MAFFNARSQILLSSGAPGLRKKQREFLPVPDDISDRRAQAGVGFHEFLIQLTMEPTVQFLHHRTAVGLMKLQPLLSRQPVLLRLRVVALDHFRGFQHVAVLVGKTFVHLNELSPPVRQAVGHNSLERTWQIAAQSVAHLDWRR